MPLYRVYFNRRGAAEGQWSVDEGTPETEQTYAEVELLHCVCRTRTLPFLEQVRYNPEHVPYAWLEVEADAVSVSGGTIYFYPSFSASVVPG